MKIRKAEIADHDALWAIIGPTIRAGETYALNPEMPRADALDYWDGDDRETFVAEEGGCIVGTYYMRANQAGGGAHIANCGFMTAHDHAGKGVARRMGEHALVHARARAYRGMQFNFVVSSNTRAVHLWQSLGFEIVGRLPGAFEHPELGFVDAFIMFQPLCDRLGDGFVEQ